MTNNAIRQVAVTYKGLWTKAKKNAEQLRKGITRKRYKGLDKAAKYISPTIIYNYGYDYGFKQQQYISIKQFYLIVSLELTIAEPTPDDLQTVVGVDVGQRYLATTATSSKQQFFSGKGVRNKADHFVRKQKQLQRKGTRSAIRRLCLMSRRERQFKLNTNHAIAKTIIKEHPHALIGMEELTGIRERTKRRKYRRKGEKLLPLTSKQRRAHHHASKWAFAELHHVLVYKATLTGSKAIKVDANYTSKACPMCGHIGEANRPHNGLLFVCQSCHYTLHADLVGARNIAMRTCLIRQDWMRTGVLSARPDVSDDEAKAERLKRYSELRWSPDTSLLSSDN